MTNRQRPAPASGGRRVATIRDVADDAQVGTTTVSRALNNSGYVADEVRQRVLASVERLGYRPSARARSMRNRRSMTIGVVLPELVNPVYLEFLRGVEDIAQREGYVTVIGSSHHDRTRETAILDRMVSERVDGLIVGRMDLAPATARWIADQDIAVAPFPGAATKRHDRSWIAAESDATAVMAHRLIDLGHRTVMIVTFGEDDRTAPPPYRRSRARVIKSIMDEVGADLRHVSIPRNAPLLAAAELIAEALRRDREQPTAVVAATHLIAPYVLYALKTVGVAVPSDISVVAYGDSLWAMAYQPALSVIRHDTYLEAVQLTEMLLNDIEQGPERTQVDYRAEYVERESTAVARRSRSRSTGSR